MSGFALVTGYLQTCVLGTDLNQMRSHVASNAPSGARMWVTLLSTLDNSECIQSSTVQLSPSLALLG